MPRLVVADSTVSDGVVSAEASFASGVGAGADACWVSGESCDSVAAETAREVLDASGSSALSSAMSKSGIVLAVAGSAAGEVSDGTSAILGTVGTGSGLIMAAFVSIILLGASGVA